MPGSFLECVINSNLKLDASATVGDTVGQVLEIVTYPRGGLELVKTAYASMSSVYDQMPGSASGGLPDNVTFAGGSNKIANIALIF